MSGKKVLDSANMRLFYQPEGRLRLTLDDRSYLEVKLVWASPLSYPHRYMGILDGKGKEIAMIDRPSQELAADSWAIAKQELDRRYLNGTISQIHSAKTEFGSTYWDVETNRGRREFVTQSLQENAQWLSEEFLLIIDVDGNRYEIPDIHQLDPKSYKILSSTV